VIAVVAAVQFDPRPGDVEGNLGRLEALASEAVDRGAELVVLPECCLSGYQLDRPQALAAAVDMRGPELDRLRGLSEGLAATLVIGALERAGDTLYNSAVTVVPGRSPVVYRKTHLPRMGVDVYCAPGDTPYRPISTPIGSIGVLICYDLRFPEPARLLALAGVELLAVPTNWPSTATDYAEFLLRARASENRLAVVAADRCGAEREVSYLGRSQVLDAQGTVLLEAGSGPEILVHPIDQRDAEDRRVLGRPDGPEGLLADRRIDLYDVQDLSMLQRSPRS
jgi:predicted amidohydrolase